MNLDTFKLKKGRMNLLHCRFNVDGAIKTVLIAMCYKLFFETEQTHQPPSLTHNTQPHSYFVHVLKIEYG